MEIMTQKIKKKKKKILDLKEKNKKYSVQISDLLKIIEKNEKSTKINEQRPFKNILSKTTDLEYNDVSKTPNLKKSYQTEFNKPKIVEESDDFKLILERNDILKKVDDLEKMAFKILNEDDLN